MIITAAHSRLPRRPRRPVNLGLILAMILISCRTPTPAAPSMRDLPPDCPEAPPAMSGIEELEALARSTREARANLMTRVVGGPEALFATLHPIELSLMEAILDGPGKARSMDPIWLRDHLLRTSVVVHAQRPLETLDGDAGGALLSDSQGREYPALYMTTQSDSKGWLYRFYFDPRVAVVQDSMSRLTFQLQLGRSRAKANWALSQRNLAALEGLPIQHLLVPLQRMRWARWDLLTGDHDAAAEDAAEIAYCSPNSSQAAVLKGTLDRKRPGKVTPVRKIPLTSPESGDPKMDDNKGMASRSRLGDIDDLALLGHQPAWDLVLRAELLNRLVPMGQTGLLPAEALRRAQQALEQGLQHFAQGKIKWGLPAALLEIDQIIAKVLANALDVNAPLHPEDPALGLLELTGGPHLSAEAVTQALNHRIVLANMNLTPHWIKRPTCKDQHCRSGNILLVQRPVLKARIQSEEIWAKAHQRMGWGWVHPGLPPLKYSVTFTDHSDNYWRSEADKVKGLSALKALSLRILEQEILGPHEDSAALAMMGLHELVQAAQAGTGVPLRGGVLRGEKSFGALLKRLTPLLQSGSPGHQATAFRVLSLTSSAPMSAALKRGLRSPHAALRAAALGALHRRSRAVRFKEHLLKGTLDPDPRIKAAAFTSLLLAKDPRGARVARAWLEGPTEEQRAITLHAVSQHKVRTLGLAPMLLNQLRSSPPTEQTRQALQIVVMEMGARSARPLIKIYKNNHKLRQQIINAAQGPGFSQLLTMAAQEENPELRRDAIIKLSQEKRPPQALLEKAAKDQDLGVQLAAHIAFARQGRARSLLALGAGARGSCTQRAMVLPPLCQSMDSGSRKQLLLDAMNSDCDKLLPLVWKLILQFHPEDVKLLKAFIKYPNRRYRVQGALAALGLRRGAALGQIP